MVATPPHGDYGRLSVMLQYRFDMEKIIDVPAHAFRPTPKVESAVIRLIPLAAPPAQARDEALFARIVAAAFSQRRKTLRNSLGKFLTEAEIAGLSIAPKARAQELSVAQFVALANHAHRRVTGGA
jgi:16S rRNA (adenine1518-N6/adenine1519-N6)-dimethyltransferase